MPNKLLLLVILFYDYSSTIILSFFASCIDQNITQSAFACIVRTGQNYRTERDQVDADNDSTRQTAVLEPGDICYGFL